MPEVRPVNATRLSATMEEPMSTVQIRPKSAPVPTPENGRRIRRAQQTKPVAIWIWARRRFIPTAGLWPMVQARKVAAALAGDGIAAQIRRGRRVLVNAKAVDHGAQA
jgi:hypothetical protein